MHVQLPQPPGFEATSVAQVGGKWQDATGACIRQAGQMPMLEHLAQGTPKEEDWASAAAVSHARAQSFGRVADASCGWGPSMHWQDTSLARGSASQKGTISERFLGAVFGEGLRLSGGVRHVVAELRR